MGISMGIPIPTQCHAALWFVVVPTCSTCGQLVLALGTRCEFVESTSPPHFDWTCCWPVYLLWISSIDLLYGLFYSKSITDLQQIAIVEFGRYSCVFGRCLSACYCALKPVTHAFGSTVITFLRYVDDQWLFPIRCKWWGARLGACFQREKFTWHFTDLLHPCYRPYLRVIFSYQPICTRK